MKNTGILETIYDSAPISILISGNEGNTLYSNPRWKHISGSYSAEFQIEGLAKAVHPDDLPKIQNELDHLKNDKFLSLKWRLLNAKREAVWVHMLISPMKSKDSQVPGHARAIEDISLLHKSQQEFMIANNLELLGKLAGGIAHDLNNFLTVILGNISLAQLQLHDPQESTKFLAKAEKAVLQAHDLAEKLLTFSPGGNPVKNIVELGTLLKNAAAITTNHPYIRCELSLADDLWSVDADERQLNQVILSLMANAIQAMPQGGIIELGAKNICMMKGKRYVEICVADTGMGISAHHLQRIFEPYFTTKSRCDGLGLSICYSIVYKHGGRIKVISCPSNGSTFFLYFPASSQIKKPY